MQSKLKIFASLLLVFSFTFSFLLLASPFSANAKGHQTSGCPEGNGWVKFDWREREDSRTYEANKGYIVSEVCVKGWQQKEMFTQDGTKSCWSVSGIGNRKATVSEGKGYHCKDISEVSFKVEKKYIQCSQTVKSEGEWSEWKTDPHNKKMEYRERTVYKLDSKDNSIVCSSKVEKETRKKVYELCSKTSKTYGKWSEWQIDPEDSSKEYKERTVVWKDLFKKSHVCKTEVERKTRDVKYEECSAVEVVTGEWTEWQVDPENSSREVRSRMITSYDSKDSEKVCSSEKETEYRDVPVEEDEEEVLGEKTTTVVLASTSGGDSSTAYLLESVLLLLTGASLIYAGREYLNRY